MEETKRAEAGTPGLSDSAQIRYYQTIAREFIRLRGAPFILSPKDLELIAEWERMKIPLESVLMGIERAFESRKMRGRESGRIMALSFCRNQVLRAFGQHRDRKAGADRKGGRREAKKDRIAREIRAFLNDCPPEASGFRDLLEKALRLVAASELDEAELEILDEKVDKKIRDLVTPADRNEAMVALRAEFPKKRNEELEEVLDTKLLKSLRDRYRIPYVSPFYY
jgi:hypothetical protein